METHQQVNLGKEEILWRNQVTEGIFKKRVVETQVITNHRIRQNDSGVMFKDIDDVVVMNQHRVSQSNWRFREKLKELGDAGRK